MVAVNILAIGSHPQPGASAKRRVGDIERAKTRERHKVLRPGDALRRTPLLPRTPRDTFAIRLVTIRIDRRVYISPAETKLLSLEIVMRTTLFTLAAGAVGAVFNAGAVQAETYPFCLNRGGAGPGDCKYVTYDQCLMAISGTGGFCQPNYSIQPSSAPHDGRLLRSGRLYGSQY